MGVQYGKPLGQSLKHFIMVPNDKGYVTSDDVVQVLPYPNLKCGVYEFTEAVSVDIIWFCNTVFMNCLFYSLKGLQSELSHVNVLFFLFQGYSNIRESTLP